MSKHYEIAVLGGGPGGYVAAIRAAQLGFKTAVIEKDNLGGICLNWGCIPTKSLLKNAEVYDLVNNHAGDFGLKVDGVSYDFSKIIKRSRNVSTKIVKGVEYLIKKNKIDHIKGFGKLKSKSELEILDGDGKVTDTISADHIILSTGARPKMLDSIPVDRANIITSTEAMSLKEQPKELIVIGAGAIGVEFAYFYNVLGTKVTIIEMMDRILPIEDKEVSGTLERNFEKRKIDIYTNTKVEKAEVKDGIVTVTIEKDGEKKELKADKVLNAIGVTGNIENIGLEELGVEIEKNHIRVNKDTYRTNVEGVYAIGDVIGPPWLAHVASAEAIHCVEKIKGLEPAPIEYGSIPGCTYCQPQVASIGLTEEKAKKEGYELKIGKFPFSASGKSTAMGEREGFVKMIFDAKYGELLGAHIIGAEATELIAEVGLAKSMEATFESIVKTVHAHPTLSESIMEAAAAPTGRLSISRLLEHIDLGIIDYRQAWDLQKDLLSKRNLGEINDTLLLLEHPHTYTLGKVADPANLIGSEEYLKENNISVYNIDRGGDITYHGPGQVVGYPIINLKDWHMDTHLYLRSLEETIIKVLEEYGLESGRREGYTGVWLDERKICAIGIKVSRWITMHGFAFNINTDLNFFDGIIPCGIKDKEVTSLEKELGKRVELNEIKIKIINNFRDIFEYDIIKESTRLTEYQTH